MAPPSRDGQYRRSPGLIALNAERAAEEQQGPIRWLRPEFQNPNGAKPVQQAEFAVKSAKKGEWLPILISLAGFPQDEPTSGYCLVIQKSH